MPSSDKTRCNSLSICAVVFLGQLLLITQNVVGNESPDPPTTVIGIVVDLDGNPVGGATLIMDGEPMGMTLPDGSFSIPDLPITQGDVRVTAIATIEGEQLAGSSFGVSPVPGRITDVGEIIVDCFAPLCERTNP